MITMMEPMAVSATTKSSAVKYLLVHDLLSAKFYELSQNKTDVSKEEVQYWIAFYKDFLRKSSTQTTLLDQMVIIAGMRGVVSNMLEAAKTAELEDEAAKISELITQLTADKYLMDTRGSEFDNGAFERKASVLADLVVPGVGSKSIEIIELDLALLTPSRMAEHSFAGRILAGFTVCLIGFILIIASINYGLRPSAARKLSSRMLARLSAVDWLLILGVGVIFPVLFYLWFISSSQWSAREFGLGYETPGAMFLVQFSAMIFMIVILSSNLLRWRLHQQNSHIVAKPSRFSWVVSISIILLLPAAYYLADYPAVSTIIIGIILSLVFISVLGGLGRFCFSSKHKLAKSSVNLGFLATLSTLIISLQVLAMYHHREEVKWVMQDEFLVTAKGLPEFTSYEAEVAEQMKKENMERIKLLD